MLLRTETLMRPRIPIQCGRDNCRAPADFWGSDSPGPRTSQPQSHFKCWNSITTLWFPRKENIILEQNKIDFRLIWGVQARESVFLYSYMVTTCPDMSCLNQNCTGLAMPVSGNQTPVSTTLETCESWAGKACLSNSHPRLKSVSSGQGMAPCALSAVGTVHTHTQLVPFPKATVTA